MSYWRDYSNDPLILIKIMKEYMYHVLFILDYLKLITLALMMFAQI